MVLMSASSAPTWLDGFGDWAWPGLKPAVEIGPAPWVPALPQRIEAPAVRLRVERRRRLPRPLRLARFALLLAVAGGTFVISSGIARSGHASVATTAPPLRLVVSVTNPFAPPSAPAPPAPRTHAGGSPRRARPAAAGHPQHRRGGQQDRVDQLPLAGARLARPLPRLPAARATARRARAATPSCICSTATTSRRARSCGWGSSRRSTA